MKENKKLIQIWIDKTEYDEFEKINKENERNQSNVIRRLIKNYVKEKGSLNK